MIIKVFEIVFIAMVSLLVFGADLLMLGMIGVLILLFLELTGLPIVKWFT